MQEKDAIIQVVPVLNRLVRALCIQPYPNHPKGCPNFGRKEGCPPGAPLLEQIFDLEKPAYVVFNRFDLGAHIERMRLLHPKWSDRQLKCCLYWQGGARKELKSKIMRALKEMPDLLVLTCPEACGVDITATMNRIGVRLEWPPERHAYQIALLGAKAR